jgi:hypothetical protein
MATIRPISTGPVNNPKVVANPAGSCKVHFIETRNKNENRLAGRAGP